MERKSPRSDPKRPQKSTMFGCIDSEFSKLTEKICLSYKITLGKNIT